MFGRWDGKQTYIEALVRRMEEADRAGNEARAGAIAAKLMRECEGFEDEYLPLVTNRDLWLRLTMVEAAVPPPLPDLDDPRWADEVVL